MVAKMSTVFITLSILVFIVMNLQIWEYYYILHIDGNGLTDQDVEAYFWASQLYWVILTFLCSLYMLLHHFWGYVWIILMTMAIAAYYTPMWISHIYY